MDNQIIVSLRIEEKEENTNETGAFEWARKCLVITNTKWIISLTNYDLGKLFNKYIPQFPHQNNKWSLRCVLYWQFELFMSRTIRGLRLYLQIHNPPHMICTYADKRQENSRSKTRFCYSWHFALCLRRFLLPS